jgi:hypothetical protein
MISHEFRGRRPRHVMVLSFQFRCYFRPPTGRFAIDPLENTSALNCNTLGDMTAQSCDSFEDYFYKYTHSRINTCVHASMYVYTCTLWRSGVNPMKSTQEIRLRSGTSKSCISGKRLNLPKNRPYMRPTSRVSKNRIFRKDKNQLLLAPMVPSGR